MVERFEFDQLWRESVIGERALDGVEVMSPDSDKSPLPSKVLVQFILNINETGVAFTCELNIAEHSGQRIGTDQPSLKK